MRRRFVPVLAAAAMVMGSALLTAQFGDPDRVIPGGGVLVKGWAGKIDTGSTRQGRVLNDAKLAQDGDSLHVTTGPAVTYWNLANTASGDYTVKATFREPKFMELNSHPHSYGIFIGGTDMGSDQMSFVYCVAYGSGEVLVRGFSGPTVFTLLRQSANPAAHKAAGVGQPVTQEIRLAREGRPRRMRGEWHDGRGLQQERAGGGGQAESTDGVFGLRFTHNVEAVVSGFGVTKG